MINNRFSLLNEIFDKPLPWKEKYTSSSGVKQYLFDYVDDRSGEQDTIWVIFTTPAHKPSTTHINFISAKYGHEIANRGSGQFAIMSTILDIIKSYDDDYTPHEYRFEAKEASRIKLYDRICNKLILDYNFERAPNTGNGIYVLYRV